MLLPHYQHRHLLASIACLNLNVMICIESKHIRCTTRTKIDGVRKFGQDQPFQAKFTQLSICTHPGFPLNSLETNWCTHALFAKQMIMSMRPNWMQTHPSTHPTDSKFTANMWGGNRGVVWSYIGSMVFYNHPRNNQQTNPIIINYFGNFTLIHHTFIVALLVCLMNIFHALK